jgi:excisionase family DNA binding protein
MQWEYETIKRALDELPLFLTIRQVKVLLQVSERTLWRLITGGELEATHCGGSVRIPKHAVIKYLQEKNFLNYETAEKLSRRAISKARLDIGVPDKDSIEEFQKNLPLWKTIIFGG